ncbi:hypothetical protein Aduo_004381 [Ancylostoma duodenale]
MDKTTGAAKQPRGAAMNIDPQPVRRYSKTRPVSPPAKRPLDLTSDEPQRSKVAKTASSSTITMKCLLQQGSKMLQTAADNIDVTSPDQAQREEHLLLLKNMDNELDKYSEQSKTTLRVVYENTKECVRTPIMEKAQAVLLQRLDDIQAALQSLRNVPRQNDVANKEQEEQEPEQEQS